MAYEEIIYKKKGKIGYVTLNRPQALNAMTNVMHNELYDVWGKINEDDDVWAVVLTGTGRGFCTGADMKESARGHRKREHMGFPDRDMFVEKPIVCAINGICCGGGLVILGGCDIIIASDRAEFFDPHVSVGWNPFHENIATALRMPYGLAMRMSLMGREDRMTVERAYQVGLVSEIVPHDKLMDRATEIAEVVTRQAPLAVRDIKAAMFKLFRGSLNAMEEEWRREHPMGARRQDAVEGPVAFSEKRQPAWKGA